MTEDNIIGKVQALLAKAEVGAGTTEAEALAAAEKAQELMLKYGIELAQIAEKKGESLKVDFEVVSGRCDPWRRVLAQVVAKSLGGRTVYQLQRGKWSGIITFWGQKGTTAGAIAMYKYLEAQLVAISAIEATKVSHANAARSMSWRRSFLAGAVSRIAERLEERERAMEQSNGNGMALVRIKDVVGSAMDDHYGNLRKGAGLKARDAHGFQAGKAKGDHVDLGDKRVGHEKESLNR